MSADPYREFREAVDRPEEKIDLGRAALTIALPDYPELDLEACLVRLDLLAQDVADRLGPDAGAFRALAALNHVLFAQHGFRGNREDYFDPKNSFLNEVLERKQGIPITLSVLYMEVAGRVGLKIDGVGFPGHFLVKCAAGGEEIIIDPFNGGEIKSRSDLERLLFQAAGGGVGLRDEMLATTSKKNILRRMLANLKMIYMSRADWLKCLAALDRLLIVYPDSAEELRERGAVYLKLDCFPQARADLESYLRIRPDAEDAAAVREQIARLSKEATQIH